MSTWGNAELLVDMLERQLALLSCQSPDNAFLLVPRWLEFLSKEPQLASLINEGDEEATATLESLNHRDRCLRQEMLALWNTFKPTVCQLLQDMGGHPNFQFSDFEIRLLEDSEVYRGSQEETLKLAVALAFWADNCIQVQARTGGGDTEAMQTLSDKAKVAQQICKEIGWAIRTAKKSLIGPALYRLRSVSPAVNPPPRRLDGDDPRVNVTEEWAAYDFGAVFHEKGGHWKSNVTGIGQWLMEDVTLVTHELVQRILSGRSRLALVQRYAARCESFDSKSLRQLASNDARNAERVLTLDFAKYLFDQGLDPVLDPTIGGLRPDVVHEASGSLLYVEAKQYGSDQTRRRIIDAYKQVWSTWGRLRSHYSVPEAFLLVFRVGGPKAELPEVMSHKNLRLYSVLVDISESGGSREKDSPISLGEKELLPQESDEVAIAEGSQ